MNSILVNNPNKIYNYAEWGTGIYKLEHDENINIGEYYYNDILIKNVKTIQDADINYLKKFYHSWRLNVFVEDILELDNIINILDYFYDNQIILSGFQMWKIHDKNVYTRVLNPGLLSECVIVNAILITQGVNPEVYEFKYSLVQPVRYNKYLFYRE